MSCAVESLEDAEQVIAQHHESSGRARRRHEMAGAVYSHEVEPVVAGDVDDEGGLRERAATSELAPIPD